jgi:FMN phosphatase YigB (HAD superfamily)
MIKEPQLMQPRVGIVFDFDGTLAPDSTSAFLRHRGFDAESFWNRDVQARMDDGWDPVPAYLYELWRLSRAGGGTPITKEDFRSFGAGMKLYEGAEGIFQRISRRIEADHPGISAEFYLISSGIGDILRATKIAGQFVGIWASDFHYGDDGGLEFPSNIVSFTDKTRYLFGLSKGFVGEGYLGKPFEVNRKIPFDQIRIPLDQVIFVGDGYTDIPCFHLVRKNRGIAIGVYEKGREPRDGDLSLIEDGRVEELVPADYSPDSELSALLENAVETVAAKAAGKG